MITRELTIRKIGNSYGAILPVEVRNALNISGETGKVLISVDDKGVATLKAKSSDAGAGIFKSLKKYASAWEESGESAVEVAEKLKSGRHNKDLNVIW